MNKNIFRVVLCAMLFALCASASAQKATKIPRIGFLTGIDQATGAARFVEFRSALRELGYVEGQNIAFEYRNSDGKFDQVPELAAELVRLKVAIIVVAAGLPVIQATKNATKTIPIVMAGRGIATRSTWPMVASCPTTPTLRTAIGA